MLRAYSIDVSANSKDDLDEAQIIDRLRKVKHPHSRFAYCLKHTPFWKAGGASYDGV